MISIQSEVSGTVFRIAVRSGDTLEPNAVVLLIESMKMEISQHTPRAGRVKDILVAEGDAVDEGQVLMTLEPIN